MSTLTEKNKSQAISFPPQMLSSAKARAEADHAGNLSRYIQTLIERDLAGAAAPAPAAESTTPLTDLADRYAPGDAAELRTYLDGTNQKRLLVDILDDLLPALWHAADALRTDTEPDGRIPLIAPSERARLYRDALAADPRDPRLNLRLIAAADLDLLRDSADDLDTILSRLAAGEPADSIVRLYPAPHALNKDGAPIVAHHQILPIPFRSAPIAYLKNDGAPSLVAEPPAPYPAKPPRKPASKK